MSEHGREVIVATVVATRVCRGETINMSKFTVNSLSTDGQL